MAADPPSKDVRELLSSAVTHVKAGDLDDALTTLKRGAYFPTLRQHTPRDFAASCDAWLAVNIRSPHGRWYRPNPRIKPVV